MTGYPPSVSRRWCRDRSRSWHARPRPGAAQHRVHLVGRVGQEGGEQGVGVDQLQGHAGRWPFVRDRSSSPTEPGRSTCWPRRRRACLPERRLNCDRSRRARPWRRLPRVRQTPAVLSVNSPAAGIRPRFFAAMEMEWLTRLFQAATSSSLLRRTNSAQVVGVVVLRPWP